MEGLLVYKLRFGYNHLSLQTFSGRFVEVESTPMKLAGKLEFFPDTTTEMPQNGNLPAKYDQVCCFSL